MTEELAATDVQEQLDPEVVASESEPDNIDSVYNGEQVSSVVKRERQKAYDKGRKDAMQELQAQQIGQPEASPQAAPPMGGQSLGGMTQMSMDDIDKLIAERAPQILQTHVNQLQAKQTAEAFVGKMQAAEQKYPGLNEKLSELDFDTMAPLIQMANQMPNTGDVMKELVDNPMKMGSLMTLLYTQPKLAQREMSNLSQSIATNESAKAEEAKARDPMSQLKPSTQTGMDNGQPSIADFKKRFRT